MLVFSAGNGRPSSASCLHVSPQIRPLGLSAHHKSSLYNSEAINRVASLEGSMQPAVRGFMQMNTKASNARGQQINVANLFVLFCRRASGVSCLVGRDGVREPRALRPCFGRAPAGVWRWWNGWLSKRERTRGIETRYEEEMQWRRRAGGSTCERPISRCNFDFQM